MGTISQNLYWFGGSGDWADGADWQDPPGTTANLTPTAGDTLTIAAGDVAISAADATNFGTIDDQTIYLGSAQISGMPTLDTADETLGSGIVIDQTSDTLDAAWTARGATDFQGTANITGIDSELVLSAIPGAASNAGVFMIDYSGLMKVGGEGALDFTSGAMNVLGDLVIQGKATFEAGTSLSAPTGPSASLDAPGVLQLTEDAALTINGSETGFITFAGSDATLQIGDLAAFQGAVEGFAASDTIALSGLVANGYAYDPTTQILTLKDNGTAVGAIEIDGSYAANAFSVTTDGSSSAITLAGPVVVKDVLPVAIFANVGQQVNLATILTDAFGSTANFGTVYVSYDGAAILANNSWGYWTADASQDALATWTVPGNSAKLTPESTLGAAVTDFADTYLNVGNVIDPSADIKIPVVTQNGVVTEYLEYQINIVDPALEGSTAANLTEPTPQDIVNSALLFNATYGDGVILDAEDCQSIASDLAAAVGAVHGGDDINPNLSSSETANLNQPDGFWQIAYDGGDVNNPTSNWFGILQPGDIVRIGWSDGAGGIKNGHTTTVVSVAANHQSIQVYDNTDYDNPNDNETIGLHTVLASRWENSANPAYITVYRLRTDGRYLVQTQSANQIVHDTVYNDDVSLVGAGDTIYGGTGNEMIGGPSADLQGLTLVSGHAGDFFQFNDAVAATPTYDQSTGVLTVAYALAGNVQGDASIQLEAGMAAAFITAAATDGTGETVTIADSAVGSGQVDQVPVGSGSEGSIVLSGGAQVVDGEATDITISGGTEFIELGATDNGATLDGGAEAVYGVANGAIVNSGGYQYVEAGGTASGTTINSGAQVVLGAADDTTVNSGGADYVYAGGVASGTMVSGGDEYVETGGTASATTVNGGAEVVYGTADGATLNSGGYQYLEAGGTASGTTVNSTGVESVNGSAIGTIVNSGGADYVNSGGTTSGTTINGGIEFVEINGAATSTTVNGGAQVVYGAANGTILNSGGYQYVEAGATASGTIVNSTGIDIVLGTAIETTDNVGGADYVYAGGAATGTKVTGGDEYVEVGGMASGATVSNGAQIVYGAATSTTLDTGGYQYVASGGAASATTIGAGTLEVASGGSATGTTTFIAGGGGTLQLDDSVQFGGLIAGFGQPEHLDLSDIGFGASTHLSFAEAGGNTSGTLTVTDGLHIANLTLLGQYATAQFTSAGDRHGGTMIGDPPLMATTDSASMILVAQHQA